MRSEPMLRDSAYRAGAFTLLASVATIATALGFEFIGRYAPCPLCLMQRWAYYAAIPALFLALVAYAAGRRRAAALVFFAVALAYLANAGLGVYQAGAEWGFWPGPSTCAATGSTIAPSAGGLFEELRQGPAAVVRCDRAPWTFAGLSFAGWNVVVSLGLFSAALIAAYGATERR